MSDHLACPQCRAMVPVIDIEWAEFDCICGATLVLRFDLAGARLVDATYFSFCVSARTATIEIEVP